MATYYTCTPYSTPDLLRTSGIEPTELTIQYIYEIDVLPNKPLDLAVQHISTTLLRRIATIGNLVECMGGNTDSNGNPFRRRLRFRGRGSNSLLGIEASDGGRLETEQVCQFQTSGGEVEQFLDGVSGDLSGSVILEAEAGQSQDGEREEDEDWDGGSVLAETRVDGVIDPASVIRSALPENKEEEETKEEEEEGGAYNYLSTQSEIKEAKSIRTQPTVGEKNIIGSVSYRQGPISKLRSGTVGTKCNVIQGEITLFISNTADPFENLDGRILEAIKDDLNDEMIVQQEFLNDEVVGIRLLEPALVDDTVLPSLPTVDTTAPAVTEPPVPAPIVASAAASAPSNISPLSGFASSSASIGVIAGLGAFFLMLVGLFAYTSRPRKKSRYRLDSDNDDLKSIQYDDGEGYECDLDAVAGVMGETESTAWWQEPVRVTRTATGTSVPTVEASYTSAGIVIGDEDDYDDEEVVAKDKSPKVLPLSFFSNKKSKARDDEETGDTSNTMAMRDLIKNESLLDDDRSSSTIDMDAHLSQDVDKSKKSKSLLGRRLFGKKRTNDDDVLIDDDVIIEETSSRADSQSKGIETTTPFRAIAAYPSPSSVSSRTPPRSRSLASNGNKNANNNGIVQTCSSGALSCIPGLPSPEIGDDQTDVSALTDNYTAYYGRRGPPQCTQSDGDELMRLATDVVRQCIAPTTDNINMPSSSVGTSTRQQQLARRQRNGDADAFADCWNPFEGNFWQGWFA